MEALGRAVERREARSEAAEPPPRRRMSKGFPSGGEFVVDGILDCHLRLRFSLRLRLELELCRGEDSVPFFSIVFSPATSQRR